MAIPENTGRYIAAYYNDVADRNFGLPPDSISATHNDSLSVSSHDLGGARLTTINNRGIVNRYISFFGLAAGIPGSERELLGFPDSNTSDDLVVACPETANLSSQFLLIPSAAIHSSRLRRRRLEAPFSELPMDPKWLSVSGDKYNPGIYRHTDKPVPKHIDEVSAQLPQTTAACLSVAQLLVVRELAHIVN